MLEIERGVESHKVRSHGTFNGCGTQEAAVPKSRSSHRLQRLSPPQLSDVFNGEGFCSGVTDCMDISIVY